MIRELLMFCVKKFFPKAILILLPFCDVAGMEAPKIFPTDVVEINSTSLSLDMVNTESVKSRKRKAEDDISLCEYFNDTQMMLAQMASSLELIKKLSKNPQFFTDQSGFFFG